MTSEPQKLIHGYLDNSLTAEQQILLSEWIKADADHARVFAAEVMLHDQIRNAWMMLEYRDEEEKVQRPVRAPSRSWARSLLTMATTVCLLLFAGFLIWQTVGVTPVSAAVVELDRIIAASSQFIDRTFSIAVEETAIPQSHREQTPSDRGRPPKPSIDGALLHVRGSSQFVLQRKVNDNQYFVTGSNGKTSWAVRPDGPVRVSPDLTRFNHDVPGHEHAMPLNNLRDGLEQLHAAYVVEVMPVESPEDNSALNAEPSRLLVAVKKQGFRGPKRVEITYAVTSGQIRQIRFVDMPYGPERLTLRMTLVESRDLGAAYFDHESHHDPKRVVEFEE